MTSTRRAFVIMPFGLAVPRGRQRRHRDLAARRAEADAPELRMAREVVD